MNRVLDRYGITISHGRHRRQNDWMLVAPMKRRGYLQPIGDGYNFQYSRLEFFKTMSEALRRAKNMRVKAKAYADCSINLIDKHNEEHRDITDSEAVFLILRDGE